MPPASANANGKKPASRRACESETTSENGVNSHGTSVIAKIASEPPTTYAAHRRREASAVSGTSRSAATATAPERPNTCGASAKWSTEPLQLARVLVEGAGPLLCVRAHGRRAPHDRHEPDEEQARRDDERREGERAAANLLTPPRPAHREEAAERDPEEDRVGRMDDGEHERGERRALASRPTDGVRIAASASASAAGTSSCREAVAGSASAV